MIWNQTKDAGALTQHSHQTAPTQFVNTAGVRFAYRRFGKSTGVPPLVFNMHFTGTMDHWDPLVTDGLAATREVILFNNAGISSSSGEVPSSAEEVAAAGARPSESSHPGENPPCARSETVKVSVAE